MNMVTLQPENRGRRKRKQLLPYKPNSETGITVEKMKTQQKQNESLVEREEE